MSPEFTLFGETFRLVDDPEDMEFAFLEFAEAATSTDAGDLGGAVAVMQLLRAAVHEDDWDRFKACCRKNKARTERDLMPIVVKAAEARTDRPTQQPSGSSDGLPTIAPNSTDGSSLAERLAGRPDLYLFVEDATAARSA